MDIINYENGTGGDLVLKGNDLDTTESFVNMIYIAWFGGNIDDNWWGNDLLMENDKSIQFNSELEKALQTIELSSQGRTQIENIAKEDLVFLQEIADIDVSVSIPTVDTIQIDVILIRKENLQKEEYSFMWDSLKNEVILNKVI